MNTIRTLLLKIRVLFFRFSIKARRGSPPICAPVLKFEIEQLVKELESLRDENFNHEL